jgi:hypothetical protein
MKPERIWKEFFRQAAAAGRMGGFLHCLGLLVCCGVGVGASAKPIDYDRDVRPIFSENCYPCHGPDQNKRKAGLRLDQKDGAFAKLRDGSFALVPGDLTKSQLAYRIAPSDPQDIMPPSKTGKKLSVEQVNVLRQWITTGAAWEPHWSFVAPKHLLPPAVHGADWPRNPIDYFILAGLEEEGLRPSPPAPPAVLLRRLSLDLTGLPPTAEQSARWLRQNDPVAAAVSELLAGPHFGERAAADWLDVARYSDTHGFNNDSARSMWPWRDWVVRAFNANMPYDQFLTDQLAGDLVPHPSRDQLVASGFNRNHGINSEGGIIDEEYRVSYVNDRVRTTSMAWMGLTMECARCHDHKFDPPTQQDYYSFYAFFNNIDEVGEDGRIANAAPLLSVPTAEQFDQITALRSQIENTRERMEEISRRQDWRKAAFEGVVERATAQAGVVPTNLIVAPAFETWNLSTNTVANRAAKEPFVVRGALDMVAGPLAEPALVFDGRSELRDGKINASSNSWIFSAWLRRNRAEEGTVLSTALFSVPESSEAWGRGVEIRLTAAGQIDVRCATRWPGYAANVLTRQSIPLREWRQVAVSCDGSTKAAGLRVFIDGHECARDVLHDDALSAPVISGTVHLAGSEEKGARGLAGALARVQVFSSVSNLDNLIARWRADALRFDAETALAQRRPDQEKRLRFAWLRERDPIFAKSSAEESEAWSALLKLEAAAPTTMIMRELPSGRAAHVLYRGLYDQPREPVQADVPKFLLPFPAGAPRNRLGLAQWLTDSRNPLTARVVVNRFWQSIFGNGLVKSAGDFGYQGDFPTHPELLDWLATHFVESGWNVKELLRLIVTSATYAQSSDSTPELNERDPENLLLARGPRQRLTGEMLRDQALLLGGLLYDKQGGPPVFPYQPTNLYKGVVVAADYPGTTYTESKGRDLYRRSLYTFWKRTVPYPTLSIFDVPGTGRSASCNAPRRTRPCKPWP